VNLLLKTAWSEITALIFAPWATVQVLTLQK